MSRVRIFISGNGVINQDGEYRSYWGDYGKFTQGCMLSLRYQPEPPQELSSRKLELQLELLGRTRKELRHLSAYTESEKPCELVRKLTDQSVLIRNIYIRLLGGLVTLPKLHLKFGVSLFFSGRRTIVHQNLKDGGEQNEFKNQRRWVRREEDRQWDQQYFRYRLRKASTGRTTENSQGNKVELQPLREEGLLGTCYREVKMKVIFFLIQFGH